MAIMMRRSILSSKPEPVMMEVCHELLRVWDGVRRFNDDDCAEATLGKLGDK
jgi:hypothetical protein